MCLCVPVFVMNEKNYVSIVKNLKVVSKFGFADAMKAFVMMLILSWQGGRDSSSSVVKALAC